MLPQQGQAPVQQEQAQDTSNEFFTPNPALASANNSQQVVLAKQHHEFENAVKAKAQVEAGEQMQTAQNIQMANAISQAPGLGRVSEPYQQATQGLGVV